MLHTHNRYAYSNITTRPDYSWPTGKRLAVYVALNIEQFSYGAGKGAAIAPPIRPRVTAFSPGVTMAIASGSGGSLSCLIRSTFPSRPR